MVDRVIKTGDGWRLGWNPNSTEFQGLVGGDGWAIELTEAELNDFCSLLAQLTATMTQMASELMEEEKIAIEAESDLVWVQVEGYPQAYSVQFILSAGRRCEGFWPPAAIPGLTQTAKILKVF
ncbi:DUF1818 family protein [Microcoleus sp.]|uniref:DUF1818 family protein n=1 Tax=Microcoleus sp. TaxID=44472 RepID=UPI0035264517